MQEELNRLEALLLADGYITVKTALLLTPIDRLRQPLGARESLLTQAPSR
jgi:hypothetical protein